jgi:phosphoribosyl 1,2-cyclic phosphodiesterase
MVSFCPIASGSNGNCVYAGTGGAKILIDAGIPGIRIEEGLRSINVNPLEIDAVFLTHDHFDHVSGAGVFSRRYKTPVYATNGTWEALRIGKIETNRIKVIKPGVPVKIKDITVLPVNIPHDGCEPVGYTIFAEGAKIAVVTDIGCVTDEVKSMVKNCDVILLETNHDEEMLKRGRYPPYLKKRILSDKGHLSNKTAADMLMESVSPRLKHIYLGHLSAENNTPQLAFDTVVNTLFKGGKPNGRFSIRCALRTGVSALVTV